MMTHPTPEAPSDGLIAELLVPWSAMGDSAAKKIDIILKQRKRAASALTQDAARIQVLEERLERVREIVRREGETFFICTDCGHQHDEFLKDCDIWSMLESALTGETGT